VDLRSQGRNQRLAHTGSVDGELATIDLEAASDTCALNAIHLLFPREWATFLCDIRSPFGVIRDRKNPTRNRVIRYEKYASMGNGTTFPVETMIFASVCKALGSDRYAVYGDDIIVETELVEPLILALRFLGFVVNEAKSHSTGYYRESCGLHAYCGRVITPLYVRDLDRRKPNLCLFVNNLWRMVEWEGEVWALAKELTLAFNLRQSPLLDDPLSGVHVSAHHGYQEGLIRRKNEILYAKAYRFKAKTLRFWDSRSYFLWFFHKLKEPAMEVQTSRYSLGTHNWESTWVGYTVSTNGPDHTHAWSDFLQGNLR
jgi:hypothetical protein